VITALVFLAIIMAAIIWWLARHTINVRPWEASPAEEYSSEVARAMHASTGMPGSFKMPAIKIGLGLFLCVATSLFGLMVSAYFLRMSMPDWVKVTPPMLMWLNTGVLLASAVVVHQTRVAVHANNSTRIKSGLLWGGLLTLLFVAGQLVAWQQLHSVGNTPARNPASAFLYLFTGLHAVHVLGGLWVWARASLGAWFGLEKSKLAIRVDLCSVYWNYLLVVWLLLFATLLAN